jgi:hypothetical protein
VDQRNGVMSVATVISVEYYEKNRLPHKSDRPSSTRTEDNALNDMTAREFLLTLNREISNSAVVLNSGHLHPDTSRVVPIPQVMLSSL